MACPQMGTCTGAAVGAVDGDRIARISAAMISVPYTLRSRQKLTIDVSRCITCNAWPRSDKRLA